MSYPYDQGDFLASPPTYMYTPFLGIEFLDEYKHHRETVIERCQSALDGQKPPVTSRLRLLARAANDQLATARPPRRQWPLVDMAPYAVPGSGRAAEAACIRLAQLDRVAHDSEIQTNEVLGNLLEAVAGPGTVPEPSTIWIDRLIQRFEVTKKLHETYQPGFRRGHGEFAQARRYLDLAAILAYISIHGGNARTLSTLLKINDLLCARFDIVSSTTDLLSTGASIRIELCLVESMIAAGRLDEGR